MNQLNPSRKLEICCDIALVIGVLFTAGRTFMVMRALGTPVPEGGHRIDLVDEIAVMRFVLNVILPLAAVALATSTVVKIRERTLQPLTVALSIAALLGVFACAAALFGLFVAMHRPVNLWSQIWWTFTS